LNFKGTPSQEEHKTIFSGLTICQMALSKHSDGISSIQEYDDPLWPLLIKMALHRKI
jgi:hypothetical protein